MSKEAMEDGSYIAMTKCFYCGESKDILLHQRFKDISEVNGKVADKEPCPKCKGYMAEGIMIIEVKDGESGDNPYRTGRLHVITEDAATRMFNGFDFSKQRVCFMEESVAKVVGLHDTEPIRKAVKK